MVDKYKHDQIFRKAMENPLVSHEFFNAHLPQNIKNILDFPSIKLENTTFIEPNLRNSISDVLFSAKFDKQDGYLFLLVEHQSSPDRFMAFRLFKYMINIIDRYLTENPKTKTLPLVYPLIFYNGKKKYNVPRNLWQLFDNSELAKNAWINDYQLVNVHDTPDNEFKNRVWSGIMEFFMKHIHERELLSKWEEIKDILPQLTKISIGYDYIEMILCYTLTKIEQNDKIKLEKILSETLSQETGSKLMDSLAHAWEQVGEARGIQIGEAKGIQIGEAKGIQIGEAKGIQIGEAKGIQIGEAKGKAEGKAEMIKMMRDHGYSVEEISSIIKLSTIEISRLLELI